MKSLVVLLGVIMTLTQLYGDVELLFEVDMNGPEGIFYSQTEGVYYITDAKDSKVYKLNEENSLTTVIETLLPNTIMNPVVIGEKMYISSNKSGESSRVICFDLESNIYDVMIIEGSVSLGGITYVENLNSIFVVSQIGGLYKITLPDNNIVQVSQSVKGNGLCYDESSNKLIAASWGQKIKSISLDDYSEEVFNSSSPANYTAITKTGNKYFLSNWSGAVYMYDDLFTNRQTVLNSGLSNPVGLSVEGNKLIVCNYSYNGTGMVKGYDISTFVKVSEGNKPEKTGCINCYPNPFNPETTINFQVPEAGVYRIDIYDVYGRKIKSLVNGIYTSENINLKWDGKDDLGVLLSSGVYCISAYSENFEESKKVILMK
ncbi:MAG: T9SS type A sorting domain-containing protein [Candidatus Delongbacteria bacterium]|nr:T9SS type A sorting domain-containing protein [Candidatus Delongbacteria bacterium]MBN2836560.1 T9SS type A sorting domain-containing protein [Candidatus Delongbacteria bacterium]